MPPGTCHLSSRLVAALYPGLRYAEGQLVVTFPDGDIRMFRHSWCVGHAGTVIDPTVPALDGAELAYTEVAGGDGYRVHWPTIWADLVPEVRRRTAGLTSRAKRAEIEEVGRIFAREHERQLGRPYRPPWDRRYATT